MYSPTASAFKTVGAANAEVKNAIDTDLVAKWPAYRLKLLAGETINLKVARGGSPVVAYQSSKGAKYPDQAKPAYLNPGPFTGRNPLFYPDARWDAWATGHLNARSIRHLQGRPLTQDVSGALPNVKVRILPSDAVGAGGWIVHSAYPSV